MHHETHANSYTCPVNLKELPTALQDNEIPGFEASKIAGVKHETVLPDMHGNPMKALQWLLLHNAIRFNEGVDASDRMASLHSIHEQLWNPKIYDSPDKARDLLLEFKRILTDDIVAGPHAQQLLFRFIGDVFADRGANDLLTLDLLHTMKHVWGIEYKLHYGNHDDELLCWIENDDAYSHSISYLDRKSLEHLKRCIEKGIVTREEVKKITHDVVTPHWVAFDVNVLSENEWVMYGHSVPMIPSLFHAADKLNLELGFTIENCSKEQLLSLFDLVNHAFVETGKRGGLTVPAGEKEGLTILEGPASYKKRDFALNDICQAFDSSRKPCITSDYPFAQVTWTRRITKEEEEAHNACVTRLGLRVTRVCGHLGDAGAELHASNVTQAYAQGVRGDKLPDINLKTEPPSNTPLPNLINLDKENNVGRPVKTAKNQLIDHTLYGRFDPQTKKYGPRKNVEDFNDIHHDEGSMHLFACTARKPNLKKAIECNTISQLDQNAQRSQPLMIAGISTAALSVGSCAAVVGVMFATTIAVAMVGALTMGLGIAAGV